MVVDTGALVMAHIEEVGCSDMCDVEEARQQRALCVCLVCVHMHVRGMCFLGGLWQQIDDNVAFEI